ncbi:DUF2993 domain-containing protein [Streptomyces sp. SP18CS02]|uniref:DUF2993 domain-containing protein n=1 Tax=Streptomyces sp. SP18CS02 TaxID=3002531 RepID=UPI002E7830DF|nr:DUF2993 domain-containing protein [Streptomyces sp. SP18CS02]MEE1752128.1 DUF2993 domain-containing protein [Streptomyces sp. SP18CS02]
MSPQPRNPYDELARLADPEPDFEDRNSPGAGRTTGGSPTRNRSGDLGPGIPSDDDAEEWSPPDHRGRSRFAATPVVLKLAVTAAVGAALLGAADRLAVAYVEERAEDRIQESLHLAARPEVEIAGFPFLTQVLGKRIRAADVTVPDVAADKVSLAEVHATATDIRIVGDLPTAIQGAVVDRMDGEVLLSFDDLNRELGASQVRFTDSGRGSVHIAGSLPVAGHEVSVRAEAQVERDGDRAVSTTVEDMVLDVPGLFTYRPGADPAHSGLHLHPEAAQRISREAARAKALLSLPSIAQRLGLPASRIDLALRSEEELSRLTGSPLFLRQLMKVNLVDLVIDHPWLLEKAGIDPETVGALLKLRPPELSDRLALSFRLPSTAGDVRLRDVVVEPSGIRADLTGTGLTFGQVAGGR